MSAWKQWKNVTGTMCDSHPKKSGRITTESLLMKIPLHEDTFTWNVCNIYTKESGKISFKNKSKMCNSLNNVIMKTGHQWFKRKQQSRMCTWEQSRNIMGTLCNSYARRVEQFHWESLWNTNRKNCVAVYTT